MSDKIWVLTEPTPRAGVGGGPKDVSKARPESSRPPLPEEPDASEQRPEAWIKLPLAVNRRPFSPIAVLLALYTLGGAAPLALRVGARKFLWAALSMVSLATWVMLGWHWNGARNLLASGRLPIVPFLAVLVVATATGVVAWGRALHLVGRDERYRPEGLPAWMRVSGMTGALGLAVPGLGLLVAGCARRAALSFWNAACVGAAALIVCKRELLWTWNARAGVDGLPQAFVEGVVLASAGILVLGGLLWIATALEGARLVGRPRSMRARMRARARAQADLAAVGLLVSLVVFAAAFRPAPMARDADRFATSMRFEGYRLIPLCLERCAAALDPGRPEYALRVAEIQIERGHTDAARAIHAHLRERWDVYAQMLLHQEASVLQPAHPQPIEPAADLRVQGAALPQLVRIPPPAAPVTESTASSQAELASPAAPSPVASSASPVSSLTRTEPTVGSGATPPAAKSAGPGGSAPSASKTVPAASAKSEAATKAVKPDAPASSKSVKAEAAASSKAAKPDAPAPSKSVKVEAAASSKAAKSDAPAPSKSVKAEAAASSKAAKPDAPASNKSVKAEATASSKSVKTAAAASSKNAKSQASAPSKTGKSENSASGKSPSSDAAVTKSPKSDAAPAADVSRQKPSTGPSPAAPGSGTGEPAPQAPQATETAAPGMAGPAAGAGAPATAPAVPELDDADTQVPEARPVTTNAAPAPAQAHAAPAQTQPAPAKPAGE